MRGKSQVDSAKREARILLVICKHEREIRTMEGLRNAVLNLDPTARVEMIEHRSPHLMARACEFKPSVILTFPFTGKGLSVRFYVLKSRLNCAIICFTTEGVRDYGSESSIERYAGLDHHGSNLVDYQIFWGRWAADTLGRKLLEQGKLSSPERIKYFGHPQFEQYFGERSESLPSLPDRLSAKVKASVKNRTFLFVTGFHLADYSAQDLIRATDRFDPKGANAKEELQKWLGMVKETQRRRQEWIDMVTECASQNPDALLMVKSHPLEHEIFNRGKKKDPYRAWDDCPNILYVPEPIQVAALLSHCSLFFHYGSTTVFDSILSEVSSVYVMFKGVNPSPLYAGLSEALYAGLSGVGLLSTAVADIVDVPQLASRHLTSPIRFELTPSMEQALEMLLNIPSNRVYTPSRDIARFLLAITPGDVQRISKTDPFLVNAMKWCH